MKPTDRDIKESPLYQGEDEIIAYNLTTTPWVSSPTSPTVKLFSLSNGVKTDVSDTKLSGSASVVGDVITTPYVTGVVADTQYRLEFKWVVSGNTYEAWAYIIGQA